MAGLTSISGLRGLLGQVGVRTLSVGTTMVSLHPIHTQPQLPLVFGRQLQRPLPSRQSNQSLLSQQCLVNFRAPRQGVQPKPSPSRAVRDHHNFWGRPTECAHHHQFQLQSRLFATVQRSNPTLLQPASHVRRQLQPHAVQHVFPSPMKVSRCRLVLMAVSAMGRLRLFI